MNFLEISTNIGCKNNCQFCPQDKIIHKYSSISNIYQMSFDLFKICLDKVPSETTIIFSGMSEPWLNPRCTEMVSYAHNKGHRLFIYTSLVGMNVSDVKTLIHLSNFDYPFGFMIHLPSIDKNFENIDINPQYIATLKKMIDSGIVAEYHYHGSAINPKLKPYLKKIIHTPIQNRAGNLSFPYYNQKKITGPIACERNLHANLLLPNGDVLLCCQDYNMKHVLGNLLKTDYNSLFTDKEYLKIQKGLKNDKTDILCRYCTTYAHQLKSENIFINLIKKISNNV